MRVMRRVFVAQSELLARVGGVLGLGCEWLPRLWSQRRSGGTCTVSGCPTERPGGQWRRLLSGARCAVAAQGWRRPDADVHGPFRAAVPPGAPGAQLTRRTTHAHTPHGRSRRRARSALHGLRTRGRGRWTMCGIQIARPAIDEHTRCSTLRTRADSTRFQRKHVRGSARFLGSLS